MKASWKRMAALAVCFVLLMGLLPGCGGLNKPTEPSNPTESTSGDPIPETTVPENTDPYEETLPPDNDGIVDIGFDALPFSEEEIYQQLFDRNNKIELNLDMSDEELQKMQEDHERYSEMHSKSPIYRMGDVTITIITADHTTTYRIHEVGVRMKGNTSRTDFYDVEEGGIYKYIHLKLDFQETFDDEEYYGDDTRVWASEDQRDERKDRTFATLEKVDLRWNKCADSTYLKETYAYELYRSEGVLAPLTNLSSLDWSGIHMGIYTINEPVDDIFLEKRLPEEDLGGDLYKGGWGSGAPTFTNLNSIGVEDEDKGEFYAFDLKTNKKKSEHESLTSLIKALNSGAVTKDSYAELVDVDNFLRYAAVSYFLGNPDDLRNNYNNFYIYFLKSNGKAILIPYDYDRCLGVTHEWNPTGDGVTTDNPFADTMAGAEGHENPNQENPLFIYSVDMGGYYVAEFAQVLNQVAENEMLKPETFEDWFNTAKNLYENDVTPSIELHNGSGRDFAFNLDNGFGGNLSFETYITAKMASFNSYMENVDEYISYVRPVPVNFYIRGTFNDWSVQDDYAMDVQDGRITYTLSFSHDFEFKVYSRLQDAWYGSEKVSEDTTVPYTSSGRTNVKLEPGSYLVTFDPVTETITITEA